MGKIINVKVDVTKLDKDKFFVGQKGTYANLVVAENRDGENHNINWNHGVEGPSSDKEIKVGNGKQFTFGTEPETMATETVTDDDLPF